MGQSYAALWRIPARRWGGQRAQGRLGGARTRRAGASRGDNGGGTGRARVVKVAGWTGGARIVHYMARRETVARVRSPGRRRVAEATGRAPFRSPAIKPSARSIMRLSTATDSIGD